MIQLYSGALSKHVKRHYTTLFSVHQIYKNNRQKPLVYATQSLCDSRSTSEKCFEVANEFISNA